MKTAFRGFHKLLVAVLEYVCVGNLVHVGRQGSKPEIPVVIQDWLHVHYPEVLMDQQKDLVGHALPSFHEFHEFVR